VADNERYLRSLDYIHDARIFVDTIANEPDSIDLIVVTKDFLSITFELSHATKDRFKARTGNANIMGTAQKVQFTTVLEKNRDPHFGYEILYRKNSIASTFINATIGYSTINSDLYDGTIDEHTWHIAIERPLVSQYLHIAGAVKLAYSQTFNNYVKPDSLFYNYHYDTYDAWIGYNLGVRKFLFLKSILNRQFISIRYFRNRFNRLPYQVTDGFRHPGLGHQLEHRCGPLHDFRDTVKQDQTAQHEPQDQLADIIRIAHDNLPFRYMTVYRVRSCHVNNPCLKI